MNTILNAAAAGMRLGGVYDRVQIKLRYAATAAVAGMVAGGFIVIALLWFDVALWFYCAPRLGAAIAALICGGAFLLGALIAVLVIVLARPIAPRPRPRDASAATDALAASAIHELNGFVRDNQTTILIAAALAGLVFGSRPKRP